MEYRNAKYIEGSRIDCEINHPIHGWIPFTCDPTDSGATFNVAELYAEMQSDPATKEYIPPSQEEIDARLAKNIRTRRDDILRYEVDPIVSNPLRWADLTPEQQQLWATYRRALLDITDQTGFPNNVVWPTKPE